MTDPVVAEAQPAAAEPWLDKRGVAAHFKVSVRWIERRMEEGLPHAHIAGRAKFQVSVVGSWLERHGHIDRRGAWDDPATRDEEKR